MLNKIFKILKNYLHSRKYCKIFGITFDSHKITSLEKVLGFLFSWVSVKGKPVYQSSYSSSTRKKLEFELESSSSITINS